MTRSEYIAWMRSSEGRKVLSERAIACAAGKWMLGKSCPSVSKRNKELRTGKTYEELYGLERVVEEVKKRQKGNVAHGPRPFTEQALQTVRESNCLHREGKSYTEIYGSKQRADEESKKRSAAHYKRWEGKHRIFDDRPYQNGEAKYCVWRIAVFERDNFTCQRCCKRGGAFHAHHIKPWAQFPLLRYEISNGMTLCAKPCHKDIHREIREVKLLLQQFKKGIK